MGCFRFAGRLLDDEELDVGENFVAGLGDQHVFR
jgi:hypothetical protein